VIVLQRFVLDSIHARIFPLSAVLSKSKEKVAGRDNANVSDTDWDEVDFILVGGRLEVNRARDSSRQFERRSTDFKLNVNCSRLDRTKEESDTDAEVCREFLAVDMGARKDTHQ
jgi:hypothetical protein